MIASNGPKALEEPTGAEAAKMWQETAHRAAETAHEASNKATTAIAQTEANRHLLDAHIRHYDQSREESRAEHTRAQEGRRAMYERMEAGHRALGDQINDVRDMVAKELAALATKIDNKTDGNRRWVVGVLFSINGVVFAVMLGVIAWLATEVYELRVPLLPQ